MTESSPRLIVILKLIALGDALAAWVGWHSPESGFDPVEWSLVIWLIGGLVGLAGSLAPYKSTSARVVFIVAAIANLGSLAFVEFLMHSGFTTLSH